jgi:hypothetical protein
MEEALSNYAFIVAAPIDKNTYADESSIQTWYKFKIIETLSLPPSAATTGYPISIDPPKDSLPIAADEIVILEDGGAMKIDGFKVSYGSNNSVGYLPSQKYLILARLDSANRTGYAHGRKGVFTVSKEGGLKPIVRDYNRLHDYLQEHDQSSLDQLRSDIQERLKSKR